ncbi:MAG: zinc ABC transporter substrate-binding protein [Elainella sp. Prado103]|nr:zinc ABC transporter substrate-binding protein [Elainella sp. Prado103]
MTCSLSALEQRASTSVQPLRFNWRSTGQIGLWGLCLLIGLGGCGGTEPNPVGEAADSATAEKPIVVATSTLITDWAQQVGGEEIELVSILQPGADPHVYEPTPADTRAFETADLILYNGYNLEPGLIRLMNAAGTAADKQAVGEAVPPLQLDKEGRQVPDPHVWGNAANTIQMVEAIRDALIEQSPEDRDLFTQNADRLMAQLADLHTWIQQQTATIPVDQRKLVTTHDAFQYYAQAYGLSVAGTLIGISTEEQPSAQTVQKLVEAIRGIGVPAIFAETTINPQLISTVATEAQVKLADPPLYSDSIGAPGSNADSYIKMMVLNTETIVQNLGGQITPFTVLSPPSQ